MGSQQFLFPTTDSPADEPQEASLQEQATALIQTIDQLDEEIQQLGASFDSSGVTLEDQRRRVEGLVGKLVKIGYFESRDAAKLSIRSHDKERFIQYEDFQKRILRSIGSFREVLMSVVAGETMEGALQLRRERNSLWLTSLTRSLKKSRVKTN